ncbi:MAG: hypothetical protein EOP89_09680, partial [Lysobacteraceae bacterium]
MVERDRLKALIEYVEATERDRLRTVLDFADYRGFRRAGDDVILLPGVHVNVRDGEDHRWLSVDRLVRRPPPAPDDAELRIWLNVADDVAAVPVLRTEVPRELAIGVAPVPEDAASVRLADHPGREHLEAALEGYRREVWAAWALE